MDINQVIKEEVDKDFQFEEKDYSHFDYSCFICIQPAIQTNQEQSNSLNLLFNYLQLENSVNPVVCEGCEEHLRKFEKLWNILEKVRLEMDYLLGIVESAISSSNKDLKQKSLGFYSVRESIMKKCKEKINNHPQPHIILQKIEISNLNGEVERLISNCSDDWSPRLDDTDGDSTSSDSDYDNSIIKQESNMKDTISISMKRRGSKMSLKCPKCLKTFCSKKSLRQHNDSVHLRLKPFKCPKCLKSFSNGQNLRIHINNIHLRLKPFKCDMCEETFSSKPSLKVHLNNVHFLLKPFKCSTCNASFNSNGNYQRHIQAVHLKAFKCDVCDKSFTNSQSLQCHQATPHKATPQNSKTFSCKKCEKIFNNIKSLQRHERGVHTEKIFPCNICKKIFKNRGELNQHFSSVHEKQRHYCQVPNCHTSYSQASKLVYHYKLKHPDFAVPSKFEDYSDKYSVSSESGETIYECKFCTSKCKTVYKIRQHLKAVHGPKTFLCSDCGYAATCKGKLKRHVEAMHKTGME